MMYHFFTFPDETEFVHSEILDLGDRMGIIVHFERPNTDPGFDTARGILPDYRWTKLEGFTSEEVAAFENFLHENEAELFRRAHEHYRKIHHRSLADRAADYGGRLNLSNEMNLADETNLTADKTDEVLGDLNVP